MFTRAEQVSSTSLFACLSGVHAFHAVKLRVFTFSVRCTLHKNDVRFVFYSICYIKGSCFNFICIHLRILVPNTISI
jgi:hypothetical protein